jgi:hypothetical protein
MPVERQNSKFDLVDVIVKLLSSFTNILEITNNGISIMTTENDLQG